MAIPQGALSSTQVPSPLVTPDDRARTQYTQDWERGGIGLNDPSQGLNVRDWRAHTDGSTVWVTPDPEGAPQTAVFTGSGITEVSLAFDQNMQANLAFVEDGVQKLWWYDTLVSGMVVTTFAGARSGMLSMDDKRAGADAYNDIIFGYIRDGQVRYRQQRDRYGIEYTLGSVPGSSSRLLQLGMGTNNRMQFKVSAPFAASYTDLLADALFVVSGTDLVPLHSGAGQTATWRSRVYQLDSQLSFGWAQVEGSYPVTLRVFGDGGILVHSTVVTSDMPIRVPATRARTWQIEVESAQPVMSVRLAGTSDELEDGYAGV